MGPFEHYMYVLECGDGSLYTGYAVDVARRVAQHVSGRGAKYTRTHEPVRIVAQARFYTKRRAMRAEALFKRLSRSEKLRLLMLAADGPFEDVLARELPGLGEPDACEFVAREFAAHAEPEFAEFQARLLPTVARSRIVGVRTPELRRIAKALIARADAAVFLRALPHALFEEMQVNAFALGLLRPRSAAEARQVLRRYDRFLGYVDNWATCDQLPVAPLAAYPDLALAAARAWLESERAFAVRYGIGVLMRLFLGERFAPEHLELVARVGFGAAGASVGGGFACAGAAEGAADVLAPRPATDAYYVNMMRAWYFAEALARQPRYAWTYVEPGVLDEWTRRRTIQKGLESRKLSLSAKARLRELRDARA